jgi:glutamate 5-kinase
MTLFKDRKRIVIKIGSALLVNESFSIRRDWLCKLVVDLISLCCQGSEVIIVSSGAIALGRKSLGINISNNLTLAEKQASAAIGQIELLNTYQTEFLKYNKNTAQLLLNLEDSETRKRYINARNTLEILLSHNIIPIINENDTVVTEEISYGDNDRLAARVAQMINADILVLLSDIDGLYTTNPRIDKNARHVPLIENIDQNIKNMAGVSHTKISSGGMITKILAAEIAVKNGCDMVICNGGSQYPLSGIEDRRYSLFKRKKVEDDAKKRWMSNHLNTKGKLVIDEGAREALILGKSLLAVGVLLTKGRYRASDIVDIYDSKNTLIAIGMVNFHYETIEIIKGRHKEDIKKLLGNEVVKSVVHRNNMVIL